MPTPELSRRERKKDETRQRIFHEAIRLFREKGFEATTIEDITDSADVAKGTFFNYFPKKEAVLAYLFEQQLEPGDAEMAGLLSQARPVRDKIRQMFIWAAAVHEEDRELTRWVLQELVARAFNPGEEYHARWHDLIVRLIEQGRQHGELRGTVNPETAEAVLSGVYMASLFSWACCIHGEEDLRRELTSRLDLVFDGMVA